VFFVSFVVRTNFPEQSPICDRHTKTFVQMEKTFKHSSTKATESSEIFDYKLRTLRVLRGQIRFSSDLFWLWLRRTRFSAVRWAVFAVLVLIASLIFHASSSALEIPPLTVTINDFAKMIPPASIDDLTERLRRIRSQTGYGIVILTVRSLEDEDIESFGRKAFKNLPLTDGELQKSVLLIVARKEQKVGVQVGSELRSLFPQPQASRKLQSQVEIYFNGMRPDLGIHAGVHYIFGVIQGDFHVDSTSEEEGLEDASKRGAGAGAIFAVLMAPFFAFFVGMLWGVYATQYGVHRETRLFIGAVLGGGMAKIVAIVMTMMGTYSEGLWYFILSLSVPLGIFGSLTEYWMQGDWSGIPRVKDKVKRKPEDNMGI
jgi:uncharacterized protein